MALSNEQLEANYNFRKRVPTLETYFQEWAARSDQTRSRLNYISDIAYGAHERHTLDVFPAADPNAPFLLYIHGGYWHSGAKESLAFIAEGYVKAGISVGLVSYRLCPSVRVSDCADDVLSCVYALPELLKTRGLTPKSYSVSGHSAGGHVAAWVVGSSIQPNSKLPDVSTGIGISGIYEVWPLVPTSINDNLNLNDAEARACSPAAQDWDWSNANLILTCGGDETVDLLRQQTDFAAKINHAGGNAIECNAEGRHHFDVLYDFCDPTHELFQKCVALIKNDR